MYQKPSIFLLATSLILMTTTPLWANDSRLSSIADATGIDTAMATLPERNALTNNQTSRHLPSAVPRICALLNDGQPEVRANATPIIALFGDDGQECFLSHLESNQPTAANEIIPHLRHISQKHTQRLVALFQRDLNGAETSLRKSVMLWGVPAQNALINSYFNGRTTLEMTRDGLRDSGAKGEDLARVYLVEGQRDLPKAIELVGAMADPNAFQYLDRLYSSTNVKTQIRIIAALRFLPYELVEPRMLQALRSDMPGLQSAAIASLGDARFQDATSHLLEMLSENGVNRYDLVKALGQLRSSEAIPALKRLFVYGDHRMKKEILSACDRIRTPQAIAILMEGVTDFDAAIRHEAATLLSKDPRAL